METIRITNSFGEAVTYFIGTISDIDTAEPYYWLSEDKRSCLQYLHNI